jgi:hypothetical protein
MYIYIYLFIEKEREKRPCAKQHRCNEPSLSQTTINHSMIFYLSCNCHVTCRERLLANLWVRSFEDVNVCHRRNKHVYINIYTPGTHPKECIQQIYIYIYSYRNCAVLPITEILHSLSSLHWASKNGKSSSLTCRICRCLRMHTCTPRQCRR